MLNTLGIKVFVLLGTHNLLGKSLRVLQHISNLTTNG